MFKDDAWVKVLSILLFVLFILLFFLVTTIEDHVTKLERTVEIQQIQIDYQRDVINNINRKVLYPGGQSMDRKQPMFKLSQRGDEIEITSDNYNLIRHSYDSYKFMMDKCYPMRPGLIMDDTNLAEEVLIIGITDLWMNGTNNIWHFTIYLTALHSDSPFKTLKEYFGKEVK